ncbi:MAG: hypothetical protein WCO45_12200 [Pseudanabaena sp. ELA607]|jgi:hypothetical protein
MDKAITPPRSNRNLMPRSAEGDALNGNGHQGLVNGYVKGGSNGASPNPAIPDPTLSNHDLELSQLPLHSLPLNNLPSNLSHKNLASEGLANENLELAPLSANFNGHNHDANSALTQQLGSELTHQLTNGASLATAELDNLNAELINSEADFDQPPVATKPVNRPLTKELSPDLIVAEIPITKLQQKGDCFYLHCNSIEPTAILDALVPLYADPANSIFHAEGIRRLKIHGRAWAMGVDFPLTEAAQITAQLIESLLQSFRNDRQLRQISLKVLLQQNCLNILCESRQGIVQSIVALPLLNALRTIRPAEHFQSVTVSGRIFNESKPNWTFEIDLLAIGIAPESRPDVSEVQPQQALIEADFADVAMAEPESLSQWELLQIALLEAIQDVFLLRWLGSRNASANPDEQNLPGILPGRAAVALSGGVAVASLVMGTLCVFAMDRLLLSYSFTQSPAKAVTYSDRPERSLEAPNNGYNFHIALLNEKLALIDWQITNKRRAPDVLIVGSSRALRGIDPTALERTLAAQGYQGITVFNMGLDGATSRVVEAQITQILTKRQQPRMIIWADGLRAFNSNRNDTTYEELALSPNFKPSRRGNTEAEIRENKRNTRPVSPVVKGLETIFSGYAQRLEVRNALVKSVDYLTRSLSNRERLLAETMPQNQLSVDSKGFVAFDVQLEPNTYFQKYPKVSGDYDLDYRNFEPTGVQFDALLNVAAFCRAANIDLVILNMPLHETYLDSIRIRHEETFNKRMEELAKQESFIYLDVSKLVVQQPRLFSDPSHLNKFGAGAIAEYLAKLPQIPWRRLK